MSKHTPGPWSAYIGGGVISVCIGAIPNGKRPCIVEWPGFDSCDLPLAQQKANARLIAAAPDLLAGCIKAVELLEPFEQTGFLGEAVLPPIRAAIAAARGVAP